jgi:protease-4
MRPATPTLALWLALLAVPALAQPVAVGGDDLSRGTTLAPGGVATTDEATSLIYNPAGLGRSGRFNAWYVHERSNARGQDNDSLFASVSAMGAIGLGVAEEWLRPVGGPARGRTILGGSLGPSALSAGFAVSWFRGGPVEGLTSLDLGLQSRPLRWLALGATVRNLNTPGNSQTVLGREWTVGAGFRPFGERLTVGIDWVAAEARPVAQSRLQYTVQATVLSGLQVLGGFSHAFTSAQPLYFQVGLGLDLEHLGYLQGVSFAGDRVNWQFAARLSSDRFDSLIPTHSLAVISLGGLGSSPGGTLGALLGIPAEDRFLKLLRFLDRAALDPALDGVVLKVEGAGLGLARSDEVRTAIVRLRAAGKKVFAYLLSAGDAEYLVASACDGVFAAPQAMLTIDGLRSQTLYLGGAARQLGVQVDVARVGAYKSFPDQFTRLDMSPEQRETVNAYLDTATRTVASRVLASRPQLDAARWQAALDEGLKSARREAQLGTIDAVLTPEDFELRLKAELPRAAVDPGYRPFAARSTRWASPRRIAVVPVLGSIGGGRNQASPLGGDLVAGAESFIESLAHAASDPQVAAIVVRVDSGGGDGLASDLMYRAVLDAAKKKPVVASMGDTAASGGYYVAMGADEVFASPTTLTGSIGVFFAKPALKELAEKWGVNQVAVQRGKLAGITDLYQPWTPEQRAAAQGWVDEFYEGFITEVAARRRLTRDQVDLVARGRVWSGEDAKARGLVDSLGGLGDAVEAARRRAGASDEELEVEVVRASGGLLASMAGAAVPTALLDAPVAAPPLAPALEALAGALGPAAYLLDSPRLQARMEWTLEIK